MEWVEGELGAYPTEVSAGAVPDEEPHAHVSDAPAAAEIQKPGGDEAKEPVQDTTADAEQASVDAVGDHEHGDESGGWAEPDGWAECEWCEDWEEWEVSGGCQRGRLGATCGA